MENRRIRLAVSVRVSMEGKGISKGVITLGPLTTFQDGGTVTVGLPGESIRIICHSKEDASNVVRALRAHFEAHEVPATSGGVRDALRAIES